MDRLDSATKRLKEAAQFEEQGDLVKAKDAYVSGAEWLSHVLKFNQNEHMKPLLREHLAKAISNAERVKARLDAAKPATGTAGYAASAQPAAEASGGDLELDPLFQSLRGSIVTERPNVKWEDVAGLEQAKTVLRDATEFPTQFPHLFRHGVLKPWKGVLLYGPPGTGKTYLAKAVATNTSEDSTFLSISSADLVSKWVGESAKLVKTLFTLARMKAPAVVFIDEIDSLVSDRSGEAGKSESSSQLLSEFLSQMDGCGPATEGVTILAATNLPWNLDRAILSRFQKKIYVPLPEEEHRQQQIRIHLKKDRHLLSEKDVKQVAVESDRFSSRDLSALVQAALAECMQEFKLTKTWRRFSPHPFDAELESAYEPVWSGDWEIPADKLSASTLFPQHRPSLDHATDPATKDPCDIPTSAPIQTLNACISRDIDSVLSDQNMAKRTLLSPVQLRHFIGALKRFKPSVSTEDLGQFKAWTDKYGTSAYD